MKVAINKCYGGFGLSPLAVKRLAELKGRECYFFVNKTEHLDIESRIPATAEEAAAAFIWYAYDIPNPNEAIPSTAKWHELTDAQRQEANDAYSRHSLESGRDVSRTDLDVIRVIEELGESANGRHAKLAIVEIPDGTEFEIDEYDGIEHVAEKHQVWS